MILLVCCFGCCNCCFGATSIVWKCGSTTSTILKARNRTRNRKKGIKHKEERKGRPPRKEKQERRVIEFSCHFRFHCCSLFVFFVSISLFVHLFVVVLGFFVVVVDVMCLQFSVSL